MDDQGPLTASRSDEGRYRLLVDSEEQFRLLVQGVTDYAIYMLDLEGKVASWNAGAERIKGYRAAEIIGKHFSRFYTEEDRAVGRPAHALRVAMAEGKFESEGWRLRKDGSRFWAHVVIDPVRNDDGQPIGFAKITRDITERKEAQLALEHAREALFHSQKMDAIGQLTGGVAHDFNNLLMAILGSLELVSKRVPHDPKITPLLDNAILGAQRGAALTQRMLTFARKQELKLQGVELPSLVRGMTSLLQGSLGPAIQIVTQFPRGLAPVHTDPNQLETALLNLAVNSRDAMPEGGVIRIEATHETVGLESERGVPQGDYVRLSVIDTGHGMDAQTLSRATEPFYTTKGIGKGTGLGLSMVHGLAEQSGGRLFIRSEPGEGTTVELWLPQAHAPDEQQVFVGGLLEDENGDVEPLVVLAVDDDSLVLMNTIAMLEDLGHRVFPAASAKDALGTLRREAVDLVITDYAMPQTTGLQLAEAVKAKRPDLPVILTTGYAELTPDLDTGLPKLSKPFLQADLARIIRQVIGNRRA